ncbi:DUF1684 domain-containing protein [Deinococcus maricopensis]|uniref:DUF1684 domain-containing protein n=1 Tax=Deinococcus maricopensis (strain DSM 21211 / LMG 22137 / NRRL B-23946 / LB-34) TaxID=709986 RepID=E8U8G1_DEIML|nr:DUF1684 domain-containing protein [Deinococcus maricopensis]ADV67350.1 protein of unknown function DUF1684 [Deinococcus maricopensis DSM 21211]
MNAPDAHAALLAHRARKDAHFRTPQGPLRAAALRDFTGLAYYPPDDRYALSVPVMRAAPETITLPTTTGEERPFTRYGTAHLRTPEGDATLTLYAPDGDDRPDRVFIPFRDATSGTETYGAGRYLDAPLTHDADETTVHLDFNYAYHPYCAYGDGWSCPLPPRDNWLGVPIRAGERNP